MNGKIKTTGDLREYLAECMEKVASGELTTDQGYTIAALASGIEDGFRTENGMLIDGINQSEFGKMKIGGPSNA